MKTAAHVINTFILTIDYMAPCVWEGVDRKWSPNSALTFGSQERFSIFQLTVLDLTAYDEHDGAFNQIFSSGAGEGKRRGNTGTAFMRWPDTQLQLVDFFRARYRKSSHAVFILCAWDHTCIQHLHQRANFVLAYARTKKSRWEGAVRKKYPKYILRKKDPINKKYLLF